jgi:integrase
VPGVFKRGKTYVIRYRDPQGVEHKRSARTFAEARDLKAALAADIARGEYRSSSRVAFDVYAREWLSSYGGRTTRGVGQSTLQTYRWSIKTKAIPYFGSRRLRDLEPRDVRAYIGWLQDPKRQKRALSRATIYRHLGVLKLLLATAVEDGLLRHSPATHTRVPRPADAHLEPRRVRVMSIKQLGAVLDAVDDEWRLLFELLATTGLRIGEALELRWPDLDLWKRRLRVERQVDKDGTVTAPKTPRSVRKVPLSPELCRRLSRRQGAADERLWSSPRGQHVDRRWLRRVVLDPATSEAGVPWVTPHTFRHTCASMLLAEGRSPVVVQSWLGHHSAGFTLATYAHLLDDDALGDGLSLGGAVGGAARAASSEANDGAPTSGESAA